MSSVRVRFAPSPTGYLHVGGARTALFNYLFAKKNNGTFVLRIEDTDLERSTEESLTMQLDDLTWLGLNWDEGVNSETLVSQGKYGPYRQSERLDIYKEHAEKLIDSGQAYPCFMTDEEVETQKASLEKGAHLKSPYRDLSLEEAKNKMNSGKPYVIRFKNFDSPKTYKIKDLVRGEVSFQSDMVGDFVLMRSNGMPVYNFCCAIDDALMKISHVFRAEEHLNNSLRQLMVYEAFDFTPPQFAHMSLILGEDKKKLSKRHGATSCNEYKVNGYMPEALLNFIALLGWSTSDDEEIYTLDEIASQFDVEKLTPSPAVFDETKLKWMNSVYLKKATSEDFWAGITPNLEAEKIVISQDTQWREKVQAVFQPRLETFKDAVEWLRPLSEDKINYEEKALEALTWETTPKVIAKWIELLEAHGTDYLSESEFNDYQGEIKTQCEVKGKNLFMPIRVAITGQTHGADLKLVVPLLNKSILISRAKSALAAQGAS